VHSLVMPTGDVCTALMSRVMIMAGPSDSKGVPIATRLRGVAAGQAGCYTGVNSVHMFTAIMYKTYAVNNALSVCLTAVQKVHLGGAWPYNKA
jgi:hypothetical protein